MEHRCDPQEELRGEGRRERPKDENTELTDEGVSTAVVAEVTTSSDGVGDTKESNATFIKQIPEDLVVDGVSGWEVLEETRETTVAREWVYNAKAALHKPTPNPRKRYPSLLNLGPGIGSVGVSIAFCPCVSHN